MSIMVDGADKVEETAEFYEEFLGFEYLASVDLTEQEDFKSEQSTPFVNLRVGDVVLHIWTDPESKAESLEYTHFGIHADNFVEIYNEAKERGIFASLGGDSASPRVFDIDGNAQIYVRDPAGNVVEIDHPNIDELDKSKFAEIVERGRYEDEVHIYAEHATGSAP